MEPTFDVLWPRSPRGIQRHRLADRLETLARKKIAFLWDYLFRGDELFPVLERQLMARFEDIEILDYHQFGNIHGADEIEMIGRLPDSLRSRGVDAVVSGMGC